MKKKYKIDMVFTRTIMVEATTEKKALAEAKAEFRAMRPDCDKHKFEIVCVDSDI